MNTSIYVSNREVSNVSLAMILHCIKNNIPVKRIGKDKVCFDMLEFYDKDESTVSYAMFYQDNKWNIYLESEKSSIEISYDNALNIAYDFFTQGREKMKLLFEVQRFEEEIHWG